MSKIKIQKEFTHLKNVYIQLILTILALSILTEEFKDKMEEWKLIKLKAKRWIKKAKDGILYSMANIMHDNQEK